MMKATYLLMFIEKHYKTTENGIPREKWARIFPDTKSQIEYVSDLRLYWRGMGGGKDLKLTSTDQDWTYFLSEGKFPEEFRISTEDYRKLLAKAEEEGEKQRKERDGRSKSEDSHKPLP